MAAEFGELKAPAAAELSRQIDAMDPNVSSLAGQGFGWALAKYLGEIIASGEPDIGALRAFGVDAKAAIGICTAIASRHTKVKAHLASLPAPEQPTLNLAAYRPPLSATEKPASPRSVLVAPDVAIRALPVEAAPAAPDEPLYAAQAMHMLHTLAESLRLERACPTELHRDGWSESTAEELARVINTSRSI
ncbi:MULTISPECIES: hypothetical protein [unclassified Bradyrhizobium]|uniref:hypothetical protein n=1 Tax=unclassified Bradyrhizobium TaxID=2631580 RepID=UPI002916E71C|nr:MULTISPECIES: hypothetical protein [unclassified Bradyrhizobium]